MNPHLERYTARFYSLLSNHWLIVDHHFAVTNPSEGDLRIKGRAEVWDGSPLYVTEVLVFAGRQATKVDYSYQFRREDEAGFFRYDSESHGRPQPYHHKHADQQPICDVDRAPNLFEVLKEIEMILTSEMT
jgi:hypothetical protein